MAKEVIVTADKVKERKRKGRIIRRALLILLVFLILLYVILDIIYSEGKFTVTLDSNKTLESGLAIFDSLNNSHGKRKLEATPIKFMDNISYKWLPENIDTEAEGSHNGKNYIAYSFYMENQSDVIKNYWYSIVMDDVVLNADEAIRIMIYVNDEKTVYAKGNSIDGGAEPGTTKFRDDEDGTIILEQRKDMKSGDLDKITVVIWVEGDDPECVNAIIGGHARFHMKMIEEHTEDTINEMGVI